MSKTQATTIQKLKDYQKFYNERHVDEKYNPKSYFSSRMWKSEPMIYQTPKPKTSKPKAKVCPKGKVLNPVSGRCVIIDGRVGRTQVPRVCPQGKILNPLSGKCVNIDGRAGRKLLR